MKVDLISRKFIVKQKIRIKYVENGDKVLEKIVDIKAVGGIFNTGGKCVNR